MEQLPPARPPVLLEGSGSRGAERRFQVEGALELFRIASPHGTEACHSTVMERAPPSAWGSCVLTLVQEPGSRPFPLTFLKILSKHMTERSVTQEVTLLQEVGGRMRGQRWCGRAGLPRGRGPGGRGQKG